MQPNTSLQPSYQSGPQPDDHKQTSDVPLAATAVDGSHFFKEQPDIPAHKPQSISLTSQLPGKSMGIIGLIMAFVALDLPGLFLSIISFRRARKAGRRNNLALIGIVLNALGLIALPIIIMGLIAAHNAIGGTPNTAADPQAVKPIDGTTTQTYTNTGGYGN